MFWQKIGPHWLVGTQICIRGCSYFHILRKHVKRGGRTKDFDNRWSDKTKLILNSTKLARAIGVSVVCHPGVQLATTLRLRFGMLTVLTNIRSTKVLLAMPHSDILAWLSSATRKNFISGVSTQILML